MQALSYRFPEANNPSYLAFYVLFGFFLFVFFLSKTRLGQTWSYLQVTTTSGQRLVSQNLSGTDCKTYRQQLAQLLRL